MGLSRWNKSWKVRNSYSYVATATKIPFHFQFPRLPDAAFGGLIGWLFNWKCKFSCRMISEIANYLKYNYFWDGDGIDNVTLRLWKFSDFGSRHTVSAAGDDIMFQILVGNYWCIFPNVRLFFHEIFLYTTVYNTPISFAKAPKLDPSWISHQLSICIWASHNIVINVWNRMEFKVSYGFISWHE